VLKKKINESIDKAEEMFNSIIKDIEENKPEIYLKLVSQNRHTYRPVWRDEVMVNRSHEKVLVKLLNWK